MDFGVYVGDDRMYVNKTFVLTYCMDLIFKINILWETNKVNKLMSVIIKLTLTMPNRLRFEFYIAHDSQMRVCLTLFL